MSEECEITDSTCLKPDLEREIAVEIQNNGPISFERYMELALYHPKLGYYERRPDVLGKAGDFYTSVSTGPLFGKLLAEQLLSWSRKIDWMDRWVWIEAGAHSGTLARDILEHAAHFKLPLPLEYHIIEPSATRRAWQEKTLAGFPQVKWKHSFSDYKEPLAAIIFSNELLDAFPCRLFEKDASGNWLELKVLCGEEPAAFQFCKHEACLPEAIARLAVDELPAGYRMEYSASAAQWWHEACSLLRSGLAFALDYGVTDAELAGGLKPASTVRAIRSHRLLDNWLEKPGLTDLSSAVHWDHLIETGESLGMKTLELISQERFLMGIIRDLQSENRVRLAASTQENSPAENGNMLTLPVQALKTLIHPQYLGHSFQALVQERKVIS